MTVSFQSTWLFSYCWTSISVVPQVYCHILPYQNYGYTGRFPNTGNSASIIFARELYDVQSTRFFMYRFGAGIEPFITRQSNVVLKDY
jgi:hypothetical protein